MRLSALTSLALGLILIAPGCQTDDATAPAAEADRAAEAAEADTLVDPDLLAALLGEAVVIDGTRAEVDGLLLRLAFEPLIRGAGPPAAEEVPGQGYRLTGVREGSPLWQLGLREGDVLTHAGGSPILGSEDDLREMWETRPTGATLTYRRGAESRELVLRVHTGPAWKGPTSAPSLSQDTLRLPPSEATDATLPELDDAVRCAWVEEPTSWRCEVTRATVDALLNDPSLLAKSMRIVPSVSGDETQGFKLYGIRRSTVVGNLWLRNGDLIRAIDGRPLTDIEAALEAYATLRGRSEITFALERRGAEAQAVIAIVDALSDSPAD